MGRAAGQSGWTTCCVLATRALCLSVPTLDSMYTTVSTAKTLEWCALVRIPYQCDAPPITSLPPYPLLPVHLPSSLPTLSSHSPPVHLPSSLPPILLPVHLPSSPLSVSHPSTLSVSPPFLPPSLSPSPPSLPRPSSMSPFRHSRWHLHLPAQHNLSTAARHVSERAMCQRQGSPRGGVLSHLYSSGHLVPIHTRLCW